MINQYNNIVLACQLVEGQAQLFEFGEEAPGWGQRTCKVASPLTIFILALRRTAAPANRRPGAC